MVLHSRTSRRKLQFLFVCKPPIPTILPIHSNSNHSSTSPPIPDPTQFWKWIAMGNCLQKMNLLFGYYQKHHHDIDNHHHHTHIVAIFRKAFQNTQSSADQKYVWHQVWNWTKIRTRWPWVLFQDWLASYSSDQWPSRWLQSWLFASYRWSAWCEILVSLVQNKIEKWNTFKLSEIC